MDLWGRWCSASGHRGQVSQDIEDSRLGARRVAAGGVHSLVLTEDSTVYSCGINEKGTVPVQGLEAEGSTDRFSEIVFAPDIKQLGKV